MTKSKSDTAEKPTGLALLREPFPAIQISKLPKPTKAQTDEIKQNFKAGIRCTVCGQWHHPKVIHLDYVGHAALTDRLLDCDPEWNWKPSAHAENGSPLIDGNMGMWIKLTVCGVTRLGYGHAEGKTGGDAIKEIIGDALRNAAMRFGAALDLWHKGDLHTASEPAQEDVTADNKPKPPPTPAIQPAAPVATPEPPKVKATLPIIPAGREHLALIEDDKLKLIKQEDKDSETDLADLMVWYIPQIVKLKTLITTISDNVGVLRDIKSSDGMDPIDQGSHDWAINKLLKIKDEVELNKAWSPISGVVNGLQKTSPMLYSGIVRGFRQIREDIKTTVKGTV